MTAIKRTRMSPLTADAHTPTVEHFIETPAEIHCRLLGSVAFGSGVASGRRVEAAVVAGVGVIA